MQFTHRDDPSRTATLTQTDDQPVFVVQHTDAKGKARKKSFKKASVWQARDAAIRFLLNKEGYVLRGPQEGPVRWMARLMLDGYRGEIGHDVDAASGVVWVHDAQDQVHRITPDRCDTTTFALGSGTESPGASVAAFDGIAYCLAPSWTRIDGELVRQFKLYRVDASGPTLVAEVTGITAVGQLSHSAEGKVLGPAEGGAGLYGPDGLERRFACTPTAQKDSDRLGQPAAAISHDGRWVATTHSDHVLRENLATGEVTRFRADAFGGFNNVQVSNAGEVFVSGFRWPSHALWRLHETEEPVRVADDIRATVSADGTRLAEASHGRVRLYDLTRPSADEMTLAHVLCELQLPVLGMAKYGRAAFGVDGEISVLSDAYTVAALRV